MARIWRQLLLLSNKPTILPLAERKARVASSVELIAKQFPKVPAVTAKEAQALLQQQPDKYILVDVRNTEEHQVSMLSAGNHVKTLTMDEYKQQLDMHKDKTAICYCTVGYRSSLAAEELIRSGVQSVNLRGGILAWTHEGLPLVDGVNRTQETKRAHVYGASGLYQGDGYEPVYYDNMYPRALQDIGKVVRTFLGRLMK